MTGPFTNAKFKAEINSSRDRRENPFTYEITIPVKQDVFDWFKAIHPANSGFRQEDKNTLTLIPYAFVKNLKLVVDKRKR